MVNFHWVRNQLRDVLSGWVCMNISTRETPQKNGSSTKRSKEKECGLSFVDIVKIQVKTEDLALQKPFWPLAPDWDTGNIQHHRLNSQLSRMWRPSLDSLAPTR